MCDQQLQANPDSCANSSTSTALRAPCWAASHQPAPCGESTWKVKWLPGKGWGKQSVTQQSKQRYECTCTCFYWKVFFFNNLYYWPSNFAGVGWNLLLFNFWALHNFNFTSILHPLQKCYSLKPKSQFLFCVFLFSIIIFGHQHHAIQYIIASVTNQFNVQDTEEQKNAMVAGCLACLLIFSGKNFKTHIFVNF